MRRGAGGTLGLVRAQVQAIDVHVLDGLGVVAQDAEIVDGVAVYGIAVDFLVVVEDAVTPEGASADDMAICQDVPVARAHVSDEPASSKKHVASRTLAPNQQRSRLPHSSRQDRCRKSTFGRSG